MIRLSDFSNDAKLDSGSPEICCFMPVTYFLTCIDSNTEI
jgi:hypothetical protein